MKKCLNCDKNLILPLNAHSYLQSNFRLKKFCNEQCRKEYTNRLKKKNYLLKETEHNNRLKELNQLIKGKFCFVKGKKGQYYPDLIKENIDYELELFRKMNHLNEKSRKWDRVRKHILILTISDQTKNLFDEVYFFTKDNLIRDK